MRNLLLRTSLIFLLIFGLIELSWSVTWNTLPSLTLNKNWLQTETSLLHLKAPNIDTKVLEISLNAYKKAVDQGMKIKPYLTIIDFSRPSFQKRLWVFDLSSGKTLFNTWVSHGKNSGGVRPTSFSNQVGSLKSSLGVFLTENTYFGKRGLSLRLKGLEKGINNNALTRSVVIHGASYVNADTIKRNGQAGRSWGCPAVSTALVKPLINTIKNNSLIVAYYPDQKWLTQSHFVS